MSTLFELSGVTVQFGGLRALDKFSMAVEGGSIHALIGPNGAGKSTVFNCISRFYTPVEGDILFDGRSIVREPPHRIARLGIGRTFQNIELLRQLSVRENLLVGMSGRIGGYFPFGPGARRNAAERKALDDADALLAAMGLDAYAEHPAGELDFGHQKRLDIARALAAEPRLLLLDEPAAGLRNREIAELDRLLVRLVRERNITVVLVEHVMQLVMAVADRITVLNFGQKIAEGAPAEIRGDPRVIEAYLGGAGVHA